eukprot:98403_1
MSTMFAALFSILIFPITITISQCMDKSSEITTLEQECGLQSSHTVYLGSSFDPTTNTWLDISGNCRNIETGSISNPLTTHPNALNGQTYISGTPITQILFPEDVLPLEWTFFHVARYNDGVEGRIFQGYFHTLYLGFTDTGTLPHQAWRYMEAGSRKKPKICMDVIGYFQQINAICIDQMVWIELLHP